MNAASTVVSAVAGRSERLKHKVYEATGLGEVFNDSNVHLSVKSSPEKTAAALSLLAEREGLITKLNDSGSWRRRRALLVPHTFLYYFGEHTAETDLRPHGVIDLELYTDIQVVDGNLLKLAPGDETSPIRTFNLRLKDGDEAEEWAQAIRETRFGLVRDERDALRSAKMGLSDQLVTHEEAIHESLALLRASRGRESAAVSELSRRDAEEARRVEQVRALLAACTSSPASCDGGDIADNYLADPPGWARSGGERRRSSSNSCTAGSDSESSRLRGCASSSSLPERARSEASAVVGGMGTGVGGRGSSVAATSLSELAALEEVIAERAQEVASLKMANDALREKEALADDRRRRDVAEALRLRDQERERAEGEASLRSDLEAELQRLREELADSRAGREEARVNLGVVAAACREAEAKSRELQEHRWVLAREVKASRAEQRRLSAALSCATTAAAAAAATAAAAKKEASAANAAAAAASAAAASSGSRDRSSSAASSAAEGSGEEVAGRGEEEEGTGCAGGENGYGFERSSGGETLTLPTREGQLEAEQGAAQAAMEMAAEISNGGGSVHSDGAGGSGRVAPGSQEATEETLPDNTMAQTAPVVCVRPSSLDVAGVNSRRQGGGEESTSGSESGAASPEEGSPVFPGATDACEGVGDGGFSGGSGERGSGSRPDDGGFDGGPPTVGEEGPSRRRDEGRFAASKSPSPPAAGGGVGFGDEGDEELDEETCADGAVEDTGDRRGGQGEEGARSRSSSSPPPPSMRGGKHPLGTGVESGVGGGGGGDRSSSPAATAAATAEALAAAFGESSSLRLNQMVASLSAGLRETRKARRKPLLGHLDDDDEDDGCDGGGLNAGPPPVSPDEDDDGGVTDGTGTDGGDSRHDLTATAATTTTRINSGGGNGAWSAWSTVGGGGGGGGGGTDSNGSHNGSPPLLLASDEEGRRSGGVSSAMTVTMTAAGGGSADDGADERCGRDVPEVFVGAFAGESAPKILSGAVAAAAAAASEEQGVVAPPHGPSSSTEVASTSTAFVGADSSASKKAAALLRNLGRPDGEGSEGVDAQEGPQIQDDDESASSSLALTQRGNSGCGDIDECGGGAAASGLVGVVAVVGENTHGGAGVGVGDGSVGEAAVAVALAAAERGGRLSAEAAEAARRWEAKLKGSFVTMASGVRWGMAP